MLPAREIHLDFHTSQKMPNVAKKFNKAQFQEAIKLGNVNSITIFGKGHHGYCYYPTDVGTQHPTMEEGFDLAGEMMSACHEIGVRAPLYLTLGWSVLDATEHPEWVVRNADGSMSGVNYDADAKPTDTRPNCSWWHLCYSGDYAEYLYALTHEVCKRYSRLDGLFYDIVFVYDVCYCDSCRADMKKRGLDDNDEAVAKKYLVDRHHEVLEKLGEIMREYHPDASLFFNSGGAEIHAPHRHYLNTHFELEDLPTSWGGYDKMPIRAKYFSASGKEYLGMTGKFHTNWGEFGGFKLPEALRYECASLMTWGAKISVGDQLPPDGVMDKSTYENIGHAFRYAEQLEPFCYNVLETTKLGIMIDENEPSHNGLAKLLLDSQLDFDILHKPDDVNRFDVIIIAEGVVLSSDFAAAFNGYVKSGKKLLILGGGALAADGKKFAIDLPFDYRGKSDFNFDYLVVGDEISEGMVSAPIYCYSAGHKIGGNGDVLAYIREPYFNRTYESYCSHANTPYSDEVASYPAAIRNGNIIYMSHEMGSIYLDYGSAYHRRYFLNVLRMLYSETEQAVSVTSSSKQPLPSAVRLRYVKQGERYILNLLYALPSQRGFVSVLEDFPSLYNLKITIKVDKKISVVRLEPQKETIDFIQKDDTIYLNLSEFSLHQLIVIE